MERPGASRRVRRQYTTVRGSGMARVGDGWMASGPCSLSREDSRLLWGLQVCKLWTFTAHMFEGKAVECTAHSLLLSTIHCLTQ